MFALENVYFSGLFKRTFLNRFFVLTDCRFTMYCLLFSENSDEVWEMAMILDAE